MVHVVRLVRNGNSLTVAIPPTLLVTLGWQRGDTLLAWEQDGRAQIKRVAEAELISAPTSAPAARPARRRRA